MAENKQLQQVHEASWQVIDSVRATSQTIADNLVAMQDHNLKLTQNIYLSWMEVLSQQTESMQHFQQQWRQQFQTQQDAFQKLADASRQMYLDFFLAPFAFSRRLFDVTEEAMQQERESVRKAARSEQGKG